MEDPYFWKPNTTYKVVLFYKYVFINEVDACIENFASKCKEYHLLGRILVANEGVNGTLAGSEYSVDSFVKLYTLDKKFSKVDWKYSHDIGDKLPFPDLYIKKAKELISCGQARDVIDSQIEFSDLEFGGLAGTGIHLPPEEFHQQIFKTAENSKDDVLIIDVRNEMESAIGRFEGAIPLGTSTYSESWKKFDQLVTQYNLCPTDSPQNESNDSLSSDVNEKKVFMYCTGGIRCEKASAYLKAKGVKHVYQLQGGIHRYLETFPDGGLFQGKNFVFDGRVAVPPAVKRLPLPELSRSVNDMGAVGANDDADSCSETEGVEVEVVVGRCEDCSVPYDLYTWNRVCTVCRAPLLLCDDCVALTRFADELHCRRHRYLKDCYFTVLERFTLEELRLQDQLLEDIEQSLVSDRARRIRQRNRRRTIRRQREKIAERISRLTASGLGVELEAERDLRLSERMNPQLRSKNFGIW